MESDDPEISASSDAAVATVASVGVGEERRRGKEGGCQAKGTGDEKRVKQGSGKRHQQRQQQRRWITSVILTICPETRRADHSAHVATFCQAR